MSSASDNMDGSSTPHRTPSHHGSARDNTSGTEKQLWLSAGIGLVLTFFLLNIHLIMGTCIFKWDAWNQFWPWFNYLAASLGAGRAPLWGTGANCGFPFFAEPQTATFYPVALLSALLFGGGHSVFQAYWLGHWFLGAFGFFCLLKRMGLSPAGTFAGTVTFGFCGYFLGHAEHTTNIVTVAYVPWVLLLADLAHDRSLWFAFPAGLCLGLAGLGGNPGLLIYFGPMLVLWCLLKFRHVKKTAAVLLVTFATGAVILSPAYVSFITEGSTYTDRSGPLSVREACSLNRFTWGACVSLLAPSMTMAYPRLFGVLVPHIPMLNPYIGIFGLLSVVVALFDEQIRARWIWLLVFILVGFLFSLGSAGGLRVVGYYLFPPLKWVRHTGMSRIFWMLGGAILAGVLFDRLIAADKARTRELASLSVAILAGFFFLSLVILLRTWLEGDYIIRHAFNQTFQRANSFSAAFSCVSGPLVLIAAFAGALLALRYSVSKTLVAGILVFLVVADAAVHQYTNKETVCWNGPALIQAQRLENSRPADSTNPVFAMGQRKTGPAFFNLWAFDGDSCVRTNLATTSRAYDSLVGGTWPPFKETGFLGVLLHAPRFWLTPRIRCVGEKDREALSTLISSRPDAPVPVYIHSRGCVDSAEPGSWTVPGSFGSVKVLTYKPELVVLRVRAPEDCRLFGTERFAESWKADVDGRPVEVEKANFCFRAVPVPRGDHVVTMRYSPWLYKPLLALSWGLSLLIALAWVGTAIYHKVKR